VITLLNGVPAPLNVCCRINQFLKKYDTGSVVVPIVSTRYAQSCHPSLILELNAQKPQYVPHVLQNTGYVHQSLHAVSEVPRLDPISVRSGCFVQSTYQELSIISILLQS